MRFFDRSRPSRQVLRAMAESDVWAFDWDGTLLDSIGRTRGTYREIFLELGLPFDDAAFQEHYSPNWRDMYRRLGIPTDLWDRIDRRWVEIYESEVSSLIPSTADSLRWLNSCGYRLALVTAGHRDRVELELQVNGLHGVFETAVYGDEVPRQKPDPAPMVMAARYMRVDAGVIAYVGDAPEDMSMARRGGCLPIGVLTGTSTRGRLRSAGARWVAPDVGSVIAPLRDAG
jgi:HAD superfamily hydrolase (TIGR01549 family)